MTGTIVRIRQQGYGFIKPDNGDKDVFFHAQSLTGGAIFDNLKEGDKVLFDVEQGPKGPAATNVRIVAA
jgi:CspA family cold shock protein